jgi:hypothetical protein
MLLAFKNAEWLQLAAATAAAVAATASWASVRQAARIWRSSLLPFLHGQPLSVPVTMVGSELHLSVHNGGGGLAKGVGFVLASGRKYATGHLGDGFLKPGAGGMVKTELEPPEVGTTAIGLLNCRDLAENSWAWSLQGERKLLRRAKRHRWQFWRTLRKKTLASVATSQDLLRTGRCSPRSTRRLTCERSRNEITIGTRTRKGVLRLREPHA